MLLAPDSMLHGTGIEFTSWRNWICSWRSSRIFGVPALAGNISVDYPFHTLVLYKCFQRICNFCGSVVSILSSLQVQCYLAHLKCCSLSLRTMDRVMQDHGQCHFFFFLAKLGVFWTHATLSLPDRHWRVERGLFFQSHTDLFQKAARCQVSAIIKITLVFIWNLLG